MVNRILANVFSSWANLGVNVVIAFFLAPFVVHKLGNTYYGIWVIMMQFTGYLYLLDFGVRESIIRFVSKSKADGEVGELNEIISSGVLLYAGIGVICLAISAALAAAFPWLFDIEAGDLVLSRIVVIICGLTIAQSLVFNVFSGILMGLQRYDIFNKVGIIFAFIRLGLILYFLNMEFGLLALALIQLFTGVTSNLVIYFSSKKVTVEHRIPFHYTHTPFRQRIPVFGKLYNYSKYVLINNLGQKAIFYTDALVIGVMISATSVTFYAIAGNLIEYLRKIVLQAANVLNPVASELDALHDEVRLVQLILNGCKYTMIIALPICAIYLGAGQHFIGLWMGVEYAELSGQVLMVLTATVILTAPHMTLSSVLYGISKHHIISKLRIYEAMFNLCLSLLLVKQFGIVGVAFGTAIPQLLFMGVLLPVLVTKAVSFSLKRYTIDVYIRPFIAVVPYYACYYSMSSWIAPDNLAVFFLEIAFSMPVYAISVFIFCLDKSERNRIFSLVRMAGYRFFGFDSCEK